MNERTIATLKAALFALKSYEHGNAAPGLAAEIALAIQLHLSDLREEFERQRKDIDRAMVELL
jgi:hypothetical protein